MRRIVLTALLTLFSLPAHAQTDPFQLVGFSTATVQGDPGVLGMSAQCLATFGDGARMCTSVEIMETTAVPAVSGEA